MSLSAMAFAQSDAHKLDEPKTLAPKSEAQTSFDTMKTLAGDWEGPVKTDMPVAAKVDIKPLHVSMRVTSRGNVLVHEDVSPRGHAHRNVQRLNVHLRRYRHVGLHGAFPIPREGFHGVEGSLRLGLRR